MNTASPIHVGAVAFEGFELLDLFGPLEMFGLLEGDARITVMAEKAGPVKSSGGPCAMAEATMAGSEGFDVIDVNAPAGADEDATQLVDIARARNAAWIAVDGYQFGADFHRSLKAAVKATGRLTGLSSTYHSAAVPTLLAISMR